MLAVIVKNFVKQNKCEEFIHFSKKHAKISKEIDEGCLRFDVTEAKGEEVVFIELWENEDYLKKHSLRGEKAEEVAMLNKLRYDKKLEIYNIL